MNAQTDRPDIESEDGAAEAADAEGREPEAEVGSPGEDEATASLEELQAKADENWDRYLRAAAEVENVRKRATRDVEHARKYALENFGS